MFVYIQSFGLMKETVCPGADGLVAVYAAGANDTDRGFLCFHRPGLNAAGMGAQQPIGMPMDIEGVLHVACGMVLGKIECGKIMPVIFDLGAFRDGKAQAAKYMEDLIAHEGDRMMGAERNGVPGQTEVDGDCFFRCAAKVVL